MQTVTSVLAAIAAILAFLRVHWVACIVVILVWLISNVISGMPSPNGTPPTNTLWYKWAFAALHLATGSAGRVLAVVPMPDWLRAVLKVLVGSDPNKPNGGGGQ